MKTHRKVPYAILIGLILACAGLMLAQTAPDRTLFVNGKSFGMVTQIGGRSFVDVDTVAQILNGTVATEPNRILVTTSGSAPVVNASNAAPPVPQGLSKEFARAAIAALAELREWRGAIGTILTYNTPVVGNWPQDYQDRVNNDLQQVAVDATTASDQDALQLLRNDFGNIAQWSSNVVATRQGMNATTTVSENAGQNDPALAKISECSRFLSSMLVSGTFSDNASCH